MRFPAHGPGRIEREEISPREAQRRDASPPRISRVPQIMPHCRKRPSLTFAASAVPRHISGFRGTGRKCRHEVAVEDDEDEKNESIELKKQKKKTKKNRGKKGGNFIQIHTLALITVRNLTIIGNAVMNIRRLPGFMYHYKFALVLLLSGLFLVVYLLLHWGIMCTNLEAWRHVSTVCSQHRDGSAMGILCEPLCAEKGIHSLACETLHAGKEAVFSAHWEATPLVFKASRTKTLTEQFESLYWVDPTGFRHFPSEENFIVMIKDLVITKLNMTVSQRELERLARLRTYRVETDEARRLLEMENLWPLLQENEYLMTILHEDKDVFPQLIGTCGTFYAVEYVRPIETPTTVLALSDSKPEWAKRLKLAVMIFNLLEELQTNFPEPLHLCDVKINHFGLPLGGQKLKFLDLDAVFPKPIADRIVANGKSCEKHEDCDYFDCRSTCSRNKRCESPVLNNNLQIVCEKIFLGWTLSGTIIIPGLLMSEHTTSTLAVLLRQCANPDGDTTHLPRAAASDSLKIRLHNMLKEMEKEYSVFV